MNTLITSFTGGQPIYMNDFKYIQESYIEAINSLAKGFNLDTQVSFRLNGADWYITGEGGANPVLNVNEGYIYVEYGTDKGVYKVDTYATILPASADSAFVIANYSWDIQRSYIQPEGTKLFLDGNTHDVYNVEKAIFTSTPTTWVNIKNLRSLNELVTEKINTPTKKKLQAFTWDMTNFAQINVSHNLNLSQIVSVRCVIQNDSQNLKNTLPIYDPTFATLACYISSINAGSIVIDRLTDSYLNNNAEYDDGNGIRGWVIIEYI